MEQTLLKLALAVGLFALLACRLVLDILNSARSLNARMLHTGLVGILWLMAVVVALGTSQKPSVLVAILLCWAACLLVIQNRRGKKN